MEYPDAKRGVPPPEIFTESLLRYETPVLVSKRFKKKAAMASPSKASPNQPAIPGPGKPRRKGRPCYASYQPTEEILNAMLPPREWKEDRQLWVQQVSSMPCTQTDVIYLQEELNLKLQRTQAKETGFCPVRRELYRQCFDELIRQITINCAERGLLLLRVRDELNMTLDAYQRVYENIMAYSMEKSLHAMHRKADMQKKIAELEKEKWELERHLLEQKAKCDAFEKQEHKRQQIRKRTHEEEEEALRRTQKQLRAQLDALIGAKK